MGDSGAAVTFIPSIKFTVDDKTIRLFVCSVCAATIVDDTRDDGKLLDLHCAWHEQEAQR